MQTKNERKVTNQESRRHTRSRTHTHTHWHSTPTQKHTNTNIEDIAHQTLNCKREFVDCIVLTLGIKAPDFANTGIDSKVLGVVTNWLASGFANLPVWKSNHWTLAGNFVVYSCFVELFIESVMAWTSNDGPHMYELASVNDQVSSGNSIKIGRISGWPEVLLTKARL